jgi:hypothetical protein
LLRWAWVGKRVAAALSLMLVVATGCQQRSHSVPFATLP